MIRGTYRKNLSLRKAVASVIGVSLFAFSPSVILAGGPVEAYPQGAPNDADVSGAKSVEASSVKASEPSSGTGDSVSAPGENASGQPAAQGNGDSSEKPASTIFRIHARPRDSKQPTPAPQSAAELGFRGSAPSRDEESGDQANISQPAEAFRARAASRDEAEASVQRRQDLSSITPPTSADSVAAGPSNSSNQPPPQPGYYPTQTEWDTIGGYYPRYRGDNPGGAESAPDTQAPAGLWPYPSAKDPLFGAHPAFFDAIDRYVGLFAPGGVLALEGPNPSTGALLSLNGGVPLLTRSFNPNRATFKLGPAYIDILDVNTELLYSQYKGYETFPRGEGPGWLGMLSMDFRVVVPLAENLFLAATGDVFYLPRSGRVGFSAADGGASNLGIQLFAAYEKEVKGWWITLTDHLGTQDEFADIFGNFGTGAMDTAGRYSFGNEEQANESHIDLFSPDRFFLVNVVDASVIGLLNPTWRLTADMNRVDSWNLDNLTLGNDYHGDTTASVKIDYAGQDWRFAPYLQYTIQTPDDFQTFLHEAEIGIRGPITEQLRLYAEVGYSWTTGLSPSAQGLVYEVGLTHDLGPYTRQSLYAGNIVATSDFGDRREGRYIAYTLNQVLSSRLSANLRAQWDATRDIDTLDRGDGFQGGAYLTYNIGWFTNLNLGLYYERYQEAVIPTYDRWIYMASLDHRIRAGLTGRLIYQRERYQEVGGAQNFTENLFELEITQTF